MGSKHVFSFDPGGERTGFCYFKYDTETKRADLKIMKTFSPDELDEFLRVVWGLAERPEVDATFVVENFRVDSQVRGKVFQWDEMLTSQRIGAIKLVAKWTNSPVVIQEPANVLAMGRKWGPWKKLPKHIPDDKSAWLHGAHYMMNQNWFPTIDSITWYGQERIG